MSFDKLFTTLIFSRCIFNMSKGPMEYEVYFSLLLVFLHDGSEIAKVNSGMHSDLDAFYKSGRHYYYTTP